MEAGGLEMRVIPCQEINFVSVNLEATSAPSREQIGALVESSTQAEKLKPPQVNTIPSSNNEQCGISLETLAPAVETKLLQTESIFSGHNVVVNTVLEAVTAVSNERVGTSSDTLIPAVEVQLPQIGLVFSEYSAGDDSALTMLEKVTASNNEQVETLSETLVHAMEVKLPKIESVFSEYNTANDNVFSSSSETVIPAVETELPQITSIFSESNVANDRVSGSLEAVTLSTNQEVGILSETSVAVVETKLPQIESVYSEYNTANGSNFDRLEAANLNDVHTETEAETSAEAMEIELVPQIKVVYNDCDTTNDGVFDKLGDVANNKQTKPTPRMEIALPQISTVYSECNLCDDVFGDCETTANEHTQILADTVQPQWVETISNNKSGKLETVVMPSNVQIVSQTIQPEVEAIRSGLSPISYKECNKSPNSLTWNKENESELPNQIVTRVIDTELPQITEVYSEYAPSNDGLNISMSKEASTTQTENEITVESSQANKSCDNLNTVQAKETAPSSDTTKSEETEPSLEAWKQIPIKKEVIDSDEELVLNDSDTVTSGSCSNLNAIIKTEFRIKSEEVDIKDITEVARRDFECKKCQIKFSLECNYRLHMLRHTSRKPMCCDQCSYKCNKQRRMLAHLRNHTGEKKIPCKICHEYYYFFNVVEHFQKCPKLKRFSCSECEYSTGQKFYYERHVRLHTGERLKCSRCDSYFLDNVARKKHYKCHTKEKPYQCHLCYRRFKQKGARERHILAYCDRRCPKCEYISIYCTDFYEHVTYVHPFTKLRLKLQPFYRAYENALAKQFPSEEQPCSSNNMDPLLIEPEFVKYETGQNMETNPSSLPEMEFIKYEDVQNSNQKVEQNIGCEMEPSIECKLEKNVEGKPTRNTDYELIQNVKYELIEGTETCGYNANHAPMNFYTDYELMQNAKWDLTDGTENGEDNTDCEMEENIDYDLIQNVNCELTEGSEDYTLLCL